MLSREEDIKLIWKAGLLCFWVLVKTGSNNVTPNDHEAETFQPELGMMRPIES